MKKAITLLLVFLIMFPLLTACSPPELSEIKPRIEELLAASVEINDIFFGEGLPISDENDGNYYCPVDDSAKYKTQEEIKAAAGKVYTADYLNSIYKVIFQESIQSEEQSLTIRYRESEGVLYRYISPENLIKYVREYDTSTIEIIEPSNRRFVSFNINSYGYNLNLETKEQELSWKVIKLTLSLEKTGWLLDSPTY